MDDEKKSQGSDHSIAMAIWGLVLVILVPLSLIFTINGFVKGLKRNNMAAVIISSITLTIYAIATTVVIIHFAGLI